MNKPIDEIRGTDTAELSAGLANGVLDAATERAHWARYGL